MIFAEKLVAFMEGKKAEIVKILGSEYGELYFTAEDAKELLALLESSAMPIYESMQAIIIRCFESFKVVVSFLLRCEL